MSFYDNMFKEGKITTKIGMPKYGMTHTSISLFERMYEKGYTIYTNFKVLK